MDKVNSGNVGSSLELDECTTKASCTEMLPDLCFNRICNCKNGECIPKTECDTQLDCQNMFPDMCPNRGCTCKKGECAPKDQCVPPLCVDEEEEEETSGDDDSQDDTESSGESPYNPEMDGTSPGNFTRRLF